MYHNLSGPLIIEIDDDDDDDDDDEQSDVDLISSPSSPPIQIVSVESADERDLCRVCGYTGAQNHYGGLSCAPCKMFFRRHCKRFSPNYHCPSKQTCQLLLQTRRSCRYCRLERCFQIGMQTGLVRSSRSQVQVILPTENLLRDRSSLNEYQSAYLNKIINSYNTESFVVDIRHRCSLHIRDPIKIRLKMVGYFLMNIISLMYQSILPFINILPEYRSLPSDDRCLLLERNLLCLGAFNGILLFRDADLISSPAFFNRLSTIYGSQTAEVSIRIARRTEHDPRILKLFLPVLLFSTSFHVFYSNEIQTNAFLGNAQRLFYIQNLYLDIIFKYLIHHFGYFDASLRFFTLIKTILDQMICLAEANDIQCHREILQRIVEEAQIKQK